MGIKDRLSGNEATAMAMKSMNMDVMAAFPITPSTEIPEQFSQYVANGLTDTVFVPVESEHSAMSACIGSQAAGARSCTATSSNGLALMHEMLHIASAMRLPITMACITRAITGPINIHNDHSDAMSSRDCGWIQIHAEDVQEAYDNYIMSVRIAEHKKVLLPVMICQDGFITSHAVENVELLEEEDIRSFVGFYEPDYYLLNPELKVAMGPYDPPTYLMEHKRQQAEAMIDSLDVIKEIYDEFGKLTGRYYDLIETYKIEDAERIIILLGSSAGTAKIVVDELRSKGEKVGIIKIRSYRPFPGKLIREALKSPKVVAVLDKAEGLSSIGGPVYSDVCAALNGNAGFKIVNYIYGIGGRDVRTDDIHEVFADLQDDIDGKESKAKTAANYRYLALRE
ncbi:MAG: pyruvate ferredoxin oxidoreductase [Tissierellia bacterium]|nr:pyruvate ferredoxin oxidoreductase [Tissierellia bacterium]MDD4725234.1 pyruvate ferredoxin oxidoreductase [Tissierellia bacterium]